MVERPTTNPADLPAQPRHRDPISWSFPPEGWHLQLGALPHRSGPPDSSGRRSGGFSPIHPASHSAQPAPIVHVWAASLEVAPEVLDKFASWLSSDEQARAARFHFPVHRDRFVVGRGLLRSLLARYLDRKPHTLTFTYGPKGKPALLDSAATPLLPFNVAHSEDLLLIAVNRDGLLGVDVEEIRPLSDLNQMVERFSCSSECSKFGNLPSEQKATAFFNLWTRKEAWLKATGEGIAHLLNQVEVSFLPGEPARLIRLPDSFAHDTSWFLYELTPKPGFTAALAVSGQEPPSIYCWHYQPS